MAVQHGSSANNCDLHHQSVTHKKCIVNCRDNLYKSRANSFVNQWDTQELFSENAIHWDFYILCRLGVEFWILRGLINCALWGWHMKLGELAAKNHPTHATLPHIMWVWGMSPMVTLDLDEVDFPEDDQSPEIVYPDTPNVSLVERGCRHLVLAQMHLGLHHVWYWPLSQVLQNCAKILESKDGCNCPQQALESQVLPLHAMM
jgi:hypothetical protein